MNLKSKKLTIGMSIVIVLLIIGAVSALNGWFGGEGTVPEDTFTRGLVGYWSFDEGIGQTAYDASNYSNDGTLGSTSGVDTNDPKWTSNFESQTSNSGPSGTALDFDGTDDYVDCGNDVSLNITDAITIAAWIKPATTSGVHFIMSKRNAWNINNIELYENGDGVIFIIHDGSNNDDIAVASVLTADTWSHIVATFDRSYMRIYVDGVEEGTPEARPEAILTNADSLIIGAHKTGQRFNGAIDEVRIYNRALSADEIRYHYNRGGPVAEWKLDEGSGTTIYDSSGNQHHGALHE